MSLNLKITICVVAIVFIVTGFWWYSSAHQPKKNLQNNITASSTQSQNVPNVSASVGDKLTTSIKDTSNAALNNDISVIDNQLKNLNTDSVMLDQSFNQ